ncbi:hypothetical protein C7S13_4944 [Burkholderia cepacia]|nr:hypothetical protein [Burkholderia cepacia]
MWRKNPKVLPGSAVNPLPQGFWWCLRVTANPGFGYFVFIYSIRELTAKWIS